MNLHQLPDFQLEKLVQIAREHTRLAAEYGRKETSLIRKQEIRTRIDELRKERTIYLDGINDGFNLGFKAAMDLPQQEEEEIGQRVTQLNQYHILMFKNKNEA